jgi:hypothetical protein
VALPLHRYFSDGLGLYRSPRHSLEATAFPHNLRQMPDMLDAVRVSMLNLRLKSDFKVRSEEEIESHKYENFFRSLRD